MKNYFSNILNGASKLQIILFWVILAIATIIRLSIYFELSYYNDELSALVRVTEADFTDLIAYGDDVNDEHPMLIQGFLFLWTSLVGFQEWIVKLPYLIMSFITLILLFDLGSKWSKSISTGLLLMSFFAVLQLHVMYSHSIRMYISGLLFMLLFAKHLWVWLESGEYKINKHYVISVICLALIGYNHHIGMLGAVLLFLTGLFFCTKQSFKLFILIPVLAFILYLPISPMTYQQVFGYKGLSWMGQPPQGILGRFLLYIFHHEWYYLALIFTPFVIGLIFKKIPEKKILLGSLCLIISFTLLVSYTRLVAPIYQNHLLFFTLPFGLLLILNTTAKLLGKNLSGIYCILILIVGSYTLIVKRKHLELFAKQPYGELHKDINSALLHSSEEDRILVVHNLNTRYCDFYFKDINKERLQFIEFGDSLGGQKKNEPYLDPEKLKTYEKIILFNTPLYYNNLLSKYFREEKRPNFGFKQSCYYLERKTDLKNAVLEEENLSFTLNEKLFSSIDDTLSLFKDEFGPIIRLGNEVRKENIKIKCQIKCTNSFLFVLQTTDTISGKTIVYETSEVPVSTKFSTFRSSFSLKKPIPHAKTELYIWNHNKTDLALTKIDIALSEKKSIILDKEDQHYYPDILMPFNPLKNYAFTIDVDEDTLEQHSFVFANVICNDTVFSFDACDFYKFPKNKDGIRQVGMQINNLGSYEEVEGCLVKFGVHNKGTGDVRYSNPEIELYDRNFFYYGVVEKINLDTL